MDTSWLLTRSLFCTWRLKQFVWGHTFLSGLNMWQIRHEINKWYKSISRDLPYDKTTLEYAKNVCNCSKVEVVCYILIYLLSFYLIYVLRPGGGRRRIMVLTYAGLLDYSHSDSEASASQALTLRQHSRQLGGHQCGKKTRPKMHHFLTYILISIAWRCVEK